MIRLYVTLIKAHVKTIDQVHVSLRDAVQAELTKLGLDGAGNPLTPTP